MMKRLWVRRILGFGFLFLLFSTIAIAFHSDFSIAQSDAKPISPALVKPIVKITPKSEVIPNRLIDYDKFLAQAQIVGKLRSKRRVSETEFLRLAAKPGTVMLDARSTERYQDLHIQGATHLSFPDITAEALAKIIPSKTSMILIYCNNNFLNEPIAFASKVSSASLNINTFNTLYSYGYENIYELGPLLDVRTTKLPLVGNLSTKKSP
jgi:Rhodanese-like domain